MARKEPSRIWLAKSAHNVVAILRVDWRRQLYDALNPPLLFQSTQAYMLCPCSESAGKNRMLVLARFERIADRNDTSESPSIFLPGWGEGKPPRGCRCWRQTARQVVHHWIVVAVSDEQHCVSLKKSLKKNSRPSFGQIRSAEVGIRYHQAGKRIF